MIYAALDVRAKLANLAFALMALAAGEATNIVVSQREGSIARRADKNHAEILQAVRFSQLFDACASITDLEARDQTRSELIRTAAESWLIQEPKPGRHLTSRQRSTNDSMN